MAGAAHPGTVYYLAPGSYVVSEDVAFGYLAASFSGDSDASGNVTIAGGDVKVVTIINNDFGAATGSATLTVIKHVINDDGRKSVASDFTVHVKFDGLDLTGSPAAGAESPGNTYTVPPGNYVVSEDAYAHYTVSYSGDSNSSGSVTLVDGDNKTVTITNNDIRANPKTGDKTESESASWIGISAAVLGGALLLFGIFLCLLYQRKSASQR